MYLKINGLLYKLIIVFTAVFFCGAGLLPEALAAEGIKTDRQLNIVTSYPRELTDVFRRKFVKQYPDIEINVINKKTGAAIEYLDSIRDENIADLFWASSPDAFEMLKAKGLLQVFNPGVQGIPRMVAGSPVNDPEGYYAGFALSGYGYMWNTYYMNAHQLPELGNWDDLTQPFFRGHVGMSSPSRSGTTHITVETLLQTRGWQEGWNLLRKIGGNLKTVTKKSYDVPEGVRDGEFGVGIVIDFYGLSAQARNYPVRFAYPEPPTLLPANIGMIKNAPNSEVAADFIRFLLSVEGQHLLLDKDIRRLPVRPEVYAGAPGDYPNPYEDDYLKSNQPIDVLLSERRYHLVNVLFDNMVTFNLQALQEAVAAINALDVRLQQRSSAQASALLQQANELLFWLPVDEGLSRSDAYAARFEKSRKKPEDKLPAEQAAIEAGWDTQIKANYQQAKELAEQGLKLVSGG